MKTAVDYLIREFSDILGPMPNSATQDLLMVEAIKKAQEMMRKQIKDAYWAGIEGTMGDYSEAKEVGGCLIGVKGGGGAEKHYNDTYGDSKP